MDEVRPLVQDRPCGGGIVDPGRRGALVGGAEGPGGGLLAELESVIQPGEARMLFLPSGPSAAAEGIQRRRDEFGFSYFVFGADVASALAPVVAELAGR